MDLKFSPKNVPYIDLGDEGRLIFSPSTFDREKGYKFLVFSGLVRGSTKVGKKTYTNAMPVSFVLDMFFSRVPKKAKTAGLTNITKNWLKKAIKPLCDDDGYFPVSSLKTLKMLIDNTNEKEEDSLNDDPTATESYDDVEESKPRKLKKVKKPKIKIKQKKIKSKINNLKK